MNKDLVIEALKIIQNECSKSSCDFCPFSKDGDCELSKEIFGAPCSYDIDYLEELEVKPIEY